MHLRVPPLKTPLLWQLNSHKNIGSLSKLLRCCTIIVVTLNLMYVQVFRLRRKSHSLLDDPRNINRMKKENTISKTKENDFLNLFMSLVLIKRKHFDAIISK